MHVLELRGTSLRWCTERWGWRESGISLSLENLVLLTKIKWWHHSWNAVVFEKQSGAELYGTAASAQSRQQAVSQSAPPPLSHPPPLGKTLRKAPRESSALKTNTLIFEFAQTIHQFEKGLSLPEAEGKSWGQTVRVEIALADFSCQHAYPLVPKLCGNHGGWGLGGEGRYQHDKYFMIISWSIVYIRIFWVKVRINIQILPKNVAFFSYHLVIYNILFILPVTTWLKPTQPVHELIGVKFPPWAVEDFMPKVCSITEFFHHRKPNHTSFSGHCRVGTQRAGPKTQAEDWCLSSTSWYMD